MRTDYTFEDIPPYSWAAILDKFNSNYDGKPLTMDYLNDRLRSNLIQRFVDHIGYGGHPASVRTWTGAPKFHEAFPNFNLKTLNNTFDEQNRRLVNAAVDESLSHGNPPFYAPEVNKAPSYVQEAESPERRWVKDWLRETASTYYY